MGQAHHPQQRGNLGQCARDHRQGRRLVSPPSAPKAAKAPRSSPWSARSTTPAWWKCPWASPCARSSTTSAAAFRTAGNSRPSRPAAPPAAVSPSQFLDLPVDFDSLQPGRLHDGLRRHDRHGRAMTAWWTWPGISSTFLVEESCGKCTPCREGTDAPAGDPHRHHRRQRHGRAPSPCMEELCRHHGQRFPLRPGPERGQSGPEHPEILPGGVRGPYPGEKMPGRGLPASAEIHH